MSDRKKKRIHSAILASALGAVACGGNAEDSGSKGNKDPMTEGDGDGDRVGDERVGDDWVGDEVGVVGDWVGEPVGLPVPPEGTGGDISIGLIATGGTHMGGAGPVGDEWVGDVVGEPGPVGDPPFEK